MSNQAKKMYEAFVVAHKNFCPGCAECMRTHFPEQLAHPRNPSVGSLSSVMAQKAKEREARLNAKAHGK